MTKIAFEMPIVRVLPERALESRTLVEHMRIMTSAGIDFSFDQKADLEDAVEMAARTNAAVEILPSLDIAVVNDEVGPARRLDGGPEAEDLDVRRFAAATGRAALMSRSRRPSLFDPNPAYWLTRTFDWHAGRATLLCKNSRDEDVPPAWRDRPYLFDALPAFVRSDIPSDGMVAHKFVGKGLKEYAVTICKADALQAELGFDMEHQYDGGSLLQGCAFMTHEYRFLVVDWSIVGGSATLPHLTADAIGAEEPPETFETAQAPLDVRLGGPFPLDRAERVAIVRDHAAFAAGVLTAFKAEGSLDGTFTLDVFLDGARRHRGIVELNPIGLSGFFAADPGPVIRAAGMRSLASAR